MSDVADIANDLADFNVNVALANHHAAHVHVGDSAEWCEACGNEIPEARRAAIPGVDLCVDCQREAEHREKLR